MRPVTLRYYLRRATECLGAFWPLPSRCRARTPAGEVYAEGMKARVATAVGFVARCPSLLCGGSARSSHHVCYTPRGWPACFMGEGSLGNSFSASRLLEDSLFFNPTRLAPVESRMHYSSGHPLPSVRHAWANPNPDPNPNLRARERRT
jgi:hypothetical protein